MRAAATELGLDFTSAPAPPDVPRRDAPAPRLGVWVPWADTDSIGWIRYALDQRRVPYVYVRDEDVRAGRLRERLDVLLYGHVDLELAEQIHGLPKHWGPMPYKKTAATPSHGVPAESDDITGGIGWEGLGQLQRFVEDGGLLVTLGTGSALALEGGIVRGVRRAAGGVPRSSDGGGEASARRPPRARSRGRRAPTCASPSRGPTTPSPTATPRAPTCSARTSRSTTRRGGGCAWPTARRASTARRTGAASSSSGATGKARRSW